ncbi:ABC transporter ATP-binding protein [Aquibium sp. A9E412]|uniref:ABC transporter ATP-binding protein n=1 Tax=Aquibium sp. A9E412 TaxID=2976767 RepID=UPI0025B02DFE|nr:ABC transporter ATP-binding protein [Aquibium sp. A9E412]MDN2565065.1 ABC transporter ATP-binding protein [Aquibium sp. A9E412]
MHQPSPDPFLRLEGVSKRYAGGALRAVDDVSIDIRRGEFLSLLGPSGSGKTTTLMMIAGFELPSDGRIVLSGRDIVGIPAHRRNFGMVFQNYALFPHMTVFDNVAYPLRLRKLAPDAIAETVGRYLEMVGLTSYADRRPNALSGGQQQRVALARALVFDPAVVLMDEPLGALDKNLREQLQFEIKALQRKLGITLIYVTHDQSEAMTMSDRIAVFNAGHIEQIAAPIEIYRRPATRFVGEFVGESNMFEATVSDPQAGVVSTAIGPVRAAAPLDCARDAPVLAMIRPELIRPADAPPADNGTTLTVASIVHFGDRVAVEGSTADGHTVRLRLSDREAAALAPGADLAVSWRPDDVHLLVP